MKTKLSTILISTFALIASMIANPSFADSAEDEAAIRENWTTYSAARIAGDAETWLALWDEDGIQMPPGMNAEGKEQLATVIPKIFAKGSVSTMVITPIEITIATDWAYSRGVYSSDRQVKGKAVHIDGKFMTIHKRQKDGSWKIYRDIFNSNSKK